MKAHVMRELDGIDPELHEAYRICRELNAQHGKTYFLATRLLPTDKRAGVHALYGFARMVDDIVDLEGTDIAVGSDELNARRIVELDVIESRVRDALAGKPLSDSVSDQVLSALCDTVARYDIPHDYFFAFMYSMRMDIPGSPMFVSRYRTMEQLREYMYGSAAVIGLQMLPILGTVVERSEAEPPAAALGEAFQLTNFIRDMGEDLDRDRIYLPTDELAAFGVDEELLRWCRTTGNVDARVTRALAHLIAVTRSIYRTSDAGIEMLDPRVRPSMRTASILYGRILAEVESQGYRVLSQRATVPQWTRARVALPQFAVTGWKRATVR